MIVGPYRSEGILISDIRYRERRSRRTRDVHHLGLALLVIPSAVEESLIFCRGMARDVSTFARHDKMGGSSEQSQRQNLRRKTRLRAIVVQTPYNFAKASIMR